MANIEDSKKDIETGFTVVQRKNMKRTTKPTQPIYRPGNGPLRKSNTLEDCESDTNLVVNSKRQVNNDNGEQSESLRYKSEGNSPRDRVTTTRNFGDSSGDTVFNDSTRRPKKPEKMIYVPRAVAQSRENIVPSHNSSFNNNNGNNETPIDKNRDNTNSNNSSKSYSERRDNPQEQFSRWEDNSTSSQRPRQVSEPRVAEIPSTDNWSRTRDTRSVEPLVNPSRHYNSEKIQSKPPSGRRHSTIGLEYEERQKNPTASIPNFYKLPPRFQRKYLTENNLPEENWDGSSITFQGHVNFNASKGGPNYYQSGTNYNTLPTTQQNFNNAHNIMPSGYHTMPNRPRGRGRLQYNHDAVPGSNFKPRTPDLLRSPSSSRPQTPTGDNKRNEYGPTEHYETRRFPTKFNKTIPEEKPVEIENRDFTHPKQYQGNRGVNEYTKNQDDRWNKRDDRQSNRRDTEYDQDRYREPPSRDYQDKYRDRDRGRETPHRDNQDRYRDRDRRDFPDRYRNRDTPVRDNKDWDRDKYRNRDRGRDTPGRDNRGGLNMNKNDYNMDKRRGDRRNGNRRSRSKDFKRRDSIASVSSRNEDSNFYSMENVNVDDKVETEESDFKETVAPPEEKVKVTQTAVLDVGPTHLNWIEEVELNDKLESGNLSDALTRSSSVTSLQDISTKSLPPQNNATNQDHKRRKHRKKSRNR